MKIPKRTLGMPTAVAFGGMLLLWAILGGFVAIRTAHTAAYTHCTVIGKDRTSSRDGTSDMRVYTDRCGTLQVQDSILRLKFDSADRFARIEPGKTYTFTATGWRVGVLSWFPNIITSTEEHR